MTTLKRYEHFLLYCLVAPGNNFTDSQRKSIAWAVGRNYKDQFLTVEAVLWELETDSGRSIFTEILRSILDFIEEGMNDEPHRG